MVRSKPKNEPTVESLMRDVEDSFQRWEHIRDHGCSDPGWEDGINMHLIRNHIVWYYRQLAELLDGVQMDMFSEAGFCPEQYGLRPVPPKYPMDWMCPTGEHPDRLKWKR